MATLLDDVLERHDGPEPRVLTTDVQRLLQRVIRPGNDDDGASVALIAEKAGVSTRTVYRVLNPDEDKPTISLDLADRLSLAADSHVRFCTLVWPDGTMTAYGPAV
jgi:DNA-binding phage protein